MADPNESTREIWYESAGTRLFAVDAGRGCPIVFLHGGLSDHRGSALRLAALAETHRLITPDLRAAGRSVFAGALSWEQLADDTLALMQQLGLTRAVVGGMSAGSAVALKFALRHPQRVAALVLAWPVYAGSDRGLLPAQRSAKQRMNAAGQRAAREGLEALLPLFQALPPPVRELAVAMARGFDPASVAATTAFLASGAQPFARLDELAALRMPTLIIPGADPEHPPEIAAAYAAAIPGSVLADAASDLAAPIATFVRELQ